MRNNNNLYNLHTVNKYKKIPVCELFQWKKEKIKRMRITNNEANKIYKKHIKYTKGMTRNHH